MTPASAASTAITACTLGAPRVVAHGLGDGLNHAHGLSVHGRPDRLCFAIECDRPGQLPPTVELRRSAAELPGPADSCWTRSAFVVPAPRMRGRDRLLFIRRDRLELLARESAGWAAPLHEALRQFERTGSRWQLRGRALDLVTGRPRVMGVLNVTPDSFSDGGRFLAQEAAIAQGERLAAAGADLLDVGGESTRPGSQGVPVELELDRVVPVIDALARRVPIPIAVDTTKAAVAAAAIAAGAAIVNDTSALADDPALAPLVAATGAGLVLMHRLAPPATMQADPRYAACVPEVAAMLLERVGVARAAGVAVAAIVLDPGLGFGKRLADNLDLVAGAGSLRSFGFPVLLGASRKAFLGQLTGRPVGQRDAATLAITATAAWSGVELLRVHDVAGSVDLLRVLAALDRMAQP